MVRLNNDQLKQLAEFTSNLGLVFAGGVIVPIFQKIDTLNLFNVVLGLIAALLCLILSMQLIRKRSK